MFGIRIAELRRSKKLTQSQVARAIGISRSALSLYELEKREPDIQTLNKLATFFDVPVGYLSGKESQITSSSFETNPKKESGSFFFFFFDMLKRTFMSRLKKAIDDNNLSIEDLANNASIDLKNCRSYIDGNLEPSLEDLINLSHELDVSIDYLLGQISESDNKVLRRLKKLEDDNDKDIIIGEINKMIKEQCRESVAADSTPPKMTGTDNPK